MNFTLALALTDPTTRLLGVLGFLVLLPLIVFVTTRVGKRVVEKRHAKEFAVEVKTGANDEWLQRTMNGG